MNRVPSDLVMAEKAQRREEKRIEGGKEGEQREGRREGGKREGGIPRDSTKGKRADMFSFSESMYVRALLPVETQRSCDHHMIVT